MVFGSEKMIFSLVTIFSTRETMVEIPQTIVPAIVTVVRTMPTRVCPIETSVNGTLTLF